MPDQASVEASVTKRKGPRLYHKKSRNGCDRCKQRRVKCDEVLPTCSNCHRHGVSCMYEARTKQASDQGGSSQLTPSSSVVTPSSTGTPEDFRSISSFQSFNTPLGSQPGSTYSTSPNEVPGLPESSSRRLLDMRLLHHFLTTTIHTLPGAHSEVVRRCWETEIPQVALRYQPLLYEILSLAALHLVKSGSNEPEVRAARDEYGDVAARDHRHSVSSLSTETGDAVGFTCVIIVVDAFAQLQDRPIEPYEAPIHWLKLAKGAYYILMEAAQYVNGDPNAITTKIANDDPITGKYEEVFGEENRREFAELLNQDLPPGQGRQDPWDMETRNAYEMTLSYIGATRKAIMAGENQFGIARRITTFALLVPPRFVSMTQDQEPRTLAILAHYFALGAGIDLWWIGDTVRREILAIYEALPTMWLPFIREPLAAIGVM